MLKRLFFISLLGILILFPRKSQAQLETPNYTYLEKNYSQHLVFSFFSQIGYSPALSYTDFWGEAQNTSFLIFRFLGIGYEGKLNLYSNVEDFSVSLNAPVTLDYLTAEESLLLPSVGTYIMFNFNNGSTYNNIDRNGFGFGFGVQTGYWNWISDFSPIDNPVQLIPTIKIDVSNTIDFGSNKNSGFSMYIGIPTKFTNLYGKTVPQKGSIGFNFRRNIN